MMMMMMMMMILVMEASFGDAKDLWSTSVEDGIA